MEEYTTLVDSMPDWERCNRRDWTDVIKQVHATALHTDGDVMLLLLPLLLC